MEQPRIHCFYCDRSLTFESALLTPAGKTSCAECFDEFHGPSSGGGVR